MAGIDIVTGGQSQRLVSTKRHEDPDLEKFQLMVEDVLYRAHHTGQNVSHRHGGIYVAAVWTSVEREKLALAQAKSALGVPTGITPGVRPPAMIDKHYAPQGDGLQNPLLRRSTERFISEVDKLLAGREAGEKTDRVTFYAEDDRYPSLVIGIEEVR